MSEQPSTNTHLAQVATDTAEDLAWASLEIARAQRQIVRGVSELAEGIVSLSLVLLEVRRRRLFRFDPEFQTFESFVEQRHGMSAEQANLYVEALLSLGEANYRSLLADLGFQRTYALALLRRTDPTLVAAFQTLPVEERRAVTTAQIMAVDTTASEELRSRLAQLEQAITREQGLHQQTRRRLQEVEELHQRVTNSLIEERDGAQRALDQEQSQTERLRTLLAEARKVTTSQPASPPTANRASAYLPAPSDQPVPGQAAVVITCDIPALVLDVEGLLAKLRRLAEVRPDEVPSDQRKRLARGLSALDEAVADLLDTYVDE
ncbi:MAG: hypothetical protein RLZZ387_5124 [Chloroflexota bacterium]|jgi:hypothetical protein